MPADPPRFELRPPRDSDFQFCWSLYKELMESLTIELLGRWNEAGQRGVVERSLNDSGTSIIVSGDTEVGWLLTWDAADEIYLGQLYIVSAMQNRGLGTAIVQQLCARASREGKAVALEVMKNNRARLFYERLGFVRVGESEYKLNMRWQKADEESGSI
jgi:ribosomal protein S18 acetylase RimI-like enzyme